MSDIHSQIGPVGIGMDCKTLKTTFTYNGREHEAIVSFALHKAQAMWTHKFTKIELKDTNSGIVLSQKRTEEKEIIDRFFRSLRVWAAGDLPNYVLHAERQLQDIPSSSDKFSFNLGQGSEYPGDEEFKDDE
jgi:hypothetical protein